jgi:hypothetical protein
MSSSPTQNDESGGGSGVRSVMLRLPEELYEWLRTEAFMQRRSMNALGIEALLLLREQPSVAGSRPPQSSTETPARAQEGSP